MRHYWPDFNQRWLYLRRKMDEWLLAVLRKAMATAQPAMTRLSQKIELSKPYRVSIGHPDRVAILLVGTGGTGSFVAHILAQLARICAPGLSAAHPSPAGGWFCPTRRLNAPLRQRGNDCQSPLSQQLRLICSLNPRTTRLTRLMSMAALPVAARSLTARLTGRAC